MTHDLSNKAVYPRHHLYSCRDGINIFSKAVVSAGDSVMVNGCLYMLCVTKHMKGKAVKSNYHDGRKRIKYYEFGISK